MGPSSVFPGQGDSALREVLDSVPLGGLLLLASSSGSLTSTPLALQLAAERFELRRRPGQVTLPVWFDPPSPVG